MAQIDYPAHLDAMWQKAIAPREAAAPTVISTFAGGGGSLTGYMMAGYRDLLAVEWDDNAVETLRLNWPEFDIYHGDIAGLTVDEVLGRTGLEVGELDVLDGSPPCQGFSTAGKRQLDDPRNQLFREYIRLLRGLRPRVFIMENVSGMVKGKMKLIFAEIMRELKASGYRVSTRLMNAMYFHVPQSRQRLIFIGVREDLGIEPSHPRPEARPVTVKEAIGAAASFHNSSFNWKPVANRPFATLTKTKSNAHLVLDSEPRPPVPSALKVRRWSETPRGGNHHERFSLARLDWSQPLPTIQKSSSGTAGIMHPDEPRHLTISELKRAGSFPDAYQFIGNYEAVLARIGNSVPPLFMEAIGRHVRREILAAVKSPHAD